MRMQDLNIPYPSSPQLPRKNLSRSDAAMRTSMARSLYTSDAITGVEVAQGGMQGLIAANRGQRESSGESGLGKGPLERTYISAMAVRLPQMTR